MADHKGKIAAHPASDRGRKFGKRGRCPTCKGWHDRSQHWSHVKGKHKKGPRGGHYYKPIRSGEVARVSWWKGKGKSAKPKAAKRTVGKGKSVKPSFPQIRPSYDKGSAVAVPRSKRTRGRRGGRGKR